MYKTANEVIELCNKSGNTIARIAYLNECKMQGVDVQNNEIRQELSRMYGIMLDSANKTLYSAIPSVSGLTGGDAKKLNDYISTSKQTLSGVELLKAVTYALSTSEVNASMGLIVAAPTAGSSGILPAVLISLANVYKLWPQEIEDGLLVAGLIGQIIENNATISGAEGGCQAECGSAAAMAAGMAVFLRGGSVEQVFNAGAMALKNVMGLACDPVAGLVEVPCIKRNASGVSNAMLCADMALAGIVSVIPFDEVVDAMFKVGKLMPIALKETATGGLAATPTGKAIAKKILKG